MQSKKDKKEWTLSRQIGRDIHPGLFIEAICPHGVGHHKGVHGCDVSDGDKMVGCCNFCPPEIWKLVSED